MADSKTKTLGEKILAIQKDLNAPKNQRNTFGNYNYRSCEDILEALKPLLERERLVLTITDRVVRIGERYYVKAQATLSNGETDIVVYAYAREEEAKKGMDGSQITGASSSYARKYALNGLFLIDDSRDSDATNDGRKAVEKTKTASAGNPSSEKQRKLIYLLYKQKNGEEIPEGQKDKIRALNAKQASELIEKWKAAQETTEKPKETVVTGDKEQDEISENDKFIAEAEAEQDKLLGRDEDEEIDLGKVPF